MTEQQKLIEMLEALTQKAESIVNQTRGLKSVIETDLRENSVLSKENWQLAVMTLSRNIFLFGEWVKLDAQEIDEFLAKNIRPDYAQKAEESYREAGDAN